MDHWTEGYGGKKITSFLKNHVASLLTFLEKARAICAFRF